MHGNRSNGTLNKNVWIHEIVGLSFQEGFRQNSESNVND